MFPLMAWWLTIFLFWLALMQPIDLSGILAGCLVALLAASLAVVVNREGLYKLRPERKWLKFTWKIPLMLVQDFWKVLSALVQQIRQSHPQFGKFRAVPFNDDQTRGFLSNRRVLITTIVSLLPNSYAIGIDPEENMILIHEMIPSSNIKSLLS